MLRRVAFLTASVSLAFLLGGCALNFLSLERREAWRADEERACMRSRLLPASAFVDPVSKINGRGVCGIDRPLRVAGLAGGGVRVGPTATLNCPMTVAVEGWMAAAVQPAALARFGVPVVEIRQLSSYACRSRNNVRGARLSEHAFGNALDVAAFRLADGREITVRHGWRGAPDEAAFLREAFASACVQFKTVLGPGVAHHADHFHLDLAHHNKAGTSHYCRPKGIEVPPRDRRFDGVPMAGIGGSGIAAFAPDPTVTGSIEMTPLGYEPTTDGHGDAGF